MNSSPRFHGVIVPLVTPVTADGALDVPAAERLVDHVASHGCGMLVLGTTGEVASLSAELKRQYVELAVRVTARRTSVFAGAVHNCLSEAIDASRAYLALGADAVVGLLPNYFKLEAAEMQAWFERLAAGIDGPLLIYNMPATTGMSLPLEVLEALSRIGNIAGLKDSENTPGRRELVAQRLGGRPDFSLFMGVAALSIPALQAGFDGLVPSSGNLRPDLWRDLYAAARTGDWQRAGELQQRLDVIGTVFQRNRALGASLAALKAGLATRGLCGPAMLAPLRALPGSEQQEIHAQLGGLE